MEKRVRFKSAWLPWVLIAPQMVIVLVFFFWPAGQAIYQSFLREDAFGTSTEFVGIDNFVELFNDASYLASFKTTLIFSVLVAVLGLVISLMLAVMADRVIKGATGYKTLLIWPYAVAPAVAGVLWLFMFAPSIGVVAWALRRVGFDWNHLLNGTHAMALIVMAAVWKQISYNFLFFLAGLQSVPKSLIEAAAIDGAEGVEKRIDHVHHQQEERGGRKQRKLHRPEAPPGAGTVDGGGFNQALGHRLQAGQEEQEVV